MDPHLPQPPPHFFPFPATAIGAAAAVQNSAPVITPAHFIPEAPQNHVATDVAPPPAQPPSHPSYTDMIYAAITALKERDGSSRRAIAKYIERVFTGLPPTHSELLTHHLKRLKNAGLLVLVKKSYMLPRSDFAVDSSGDTGAAAVALPTNTHPEASADVPAGPKRSRGRPPKPKPNSARSDLISSSQPNAVPLPNSQSVVVPVGLSMSTQPNVDSLFNDSTFPPPSAENNVPGSSPDFQMPGKRRPGRPKKAAGQPGALPVVNSSGKRRGRPPKSGPLGVKKSPGRPRKPKSVAAGVKKNAKRLPMSVVVPYATGGAVPKRRGRPRKGEALAAPAAGTLVVPAKRPGRKRKMGARPVGRPRKVQTESQVDAYSDLKRKFEIFQSRVKQAVSLIKPTLNSETAVTAIAAIQDLEEIATLDLNAPFEEEAPLTQEPPQQVQQPPLEPQLQPPESVTHN